MLLIVTNKEDYTADFLIIELHKRNVEFFRFNTEEFPSSVAMTWEMNNGGVLGHFQAGNKRIDFQSIDSVWFRRPVSPVPEKCISSAIDRNFVIQESHEFLEGIWRTLDCFWVSRPDALRTAESKMLQLKKAGQFGFKISPTIVSNSPEKAYAFLSKRTVIYKPLDKARIDRVDHTGLIFTSLVGETEARYLENVRLAPSLFQGFIEKRVDIRVTVIGKKVFAVEILAAEPDQIKYDWRRIMPTELRFIRHELPDEISRKCVQLASDLGLQFGAIDLIQTQTGDYFFLEINPNGQWAWIQQMNPEIELREALVDLLVTGMTKKQI